MICRRMRRTASTAPSTRSTATAPAPCWRFRCRTIATRSSASYSSSTANVPSSIDSKRPRDVDEQVIPYDQRTVDLVVPLAAQAAISLENSQLYESIERLFEGFVTAAVTAIEQRDPTTSGHSERVASMTVGLARTLDGIDWGPYRTVQFNQAQLKELRYAGLLHDFGKVGVREQVLVKAKKLYPDELELIRHRHAFIKKSAETDLLRRRLEHSGGFRAP